MRTLLIDTCAEIGSIALAEGETIVGFLDLPMRSASASLPSGIRALLGEAKWSFRELNGIGVVNGPGSFTGVRVGLACAKGLCEGTGLPLAAVSRLKVLALAASLSSGFVVLNAGRGEV